MKQMRGKASHLFHFHLAVEESQVKCLSKISTKEEYKKWENGEILFWEEENKFGTREEIIEEMKNMKWSDGTLRYKKIDWENADAVDDVFSDERIKTCEKYFENDWYETYEEKYTTQNGEEVVAFGYYGHD